MLLIWMMMKRYCDANATEGGGTPNIETGNAGTTQTPPPKPPQNPTHITMSLEEYKSLIEGKTPTEDDPAKIWRDREALEEGEKKEAKRIWAESLKLTRIINDMDSSLLSDQSKQKIIEESEKKGKEVENYLIATLADLAQISKESIQRDLKTHESRMSLKERALEKLSNRNFSSSINKTVSENWQEWFNSKHQRKVYLENKKNRIGVAS